MAKQRKKTKEEKRKRQEIRRQRKRDREKVRLEFELESDETFAFIAGYTEGGAAYGVTHEEMAEIEKSEEVDFGFHFYELEFARNWTDSFIDVDGENEWLTPENKDLAVQLLIEQHQKPAKWENSDSYDQSLDWENYFGVKGKENTREELIHHLDFFDLLKGMRTSGFRNKTVE